MLLESPKKRERRAITLQLQFLYQYKLAIPPQHKSTGILSGSPRRMECTRHGYHSYPSLQLTVRRGSIFHHVSGAETQDSALEVRILVKIGRYQEIDPVVHSGLPYLRSFFQHLLVDG